MKKGVVNITIMKMFQVYKKSWQI